MKATHSKRYSVAEARNSLTRIIHEVEAGTAVELTRRGRPVAMLLSMNEFRTRRGGGEGFLEACERFRRENAVAELGIGRGFLRALRDRSRGREFRW